MFKKFCKKVFLASSLALLMGQYVPSTIGVFGTAIVHAEDKKKKEEKKTSDSSKDKDKGSGKKGNEKGQKVDESRTTKSDGSAGGRVTTYINFAAGKVADSSSLKNLTTDQLRFLGVYISNFYTPWVTDLGSSSDENAKVTEDQITDALTSTLKYDNDTAKSFSRYLMGLVRSNMKEGLHVEYASKADERESFSKSGKSSSVELTYADMLMLTSGHVYHLKGDYKGYVGEDFGSDKQRYGFIGYNGKDGKFKPVFSFDTRGEITTPSVVAFLDALSLVDVNNGLGFSVLDFKNNEGSAAGTQEALEALEKELGSKDDLYKSSIYATKVGVSPFGDLVWLGANHQYVMLPGAMNPFIFQRVSESGKDEGTFGDAVQLYNVPEMSKIADSTGGSLSGEGNKYTYVSASNPQNMLDEEHNLSGLIKYFGTNQPSLVWGSNQTSGSSESFLQKVLTKSKSDELAGFWRKDFAKPREIPVGDIDESSKYFPLAFFSYSTSYDKQTKHWLEPTSVPAMAKMMQADSLGASGWVSDAGSNADSYGSSDGDKLKTLNFISMSSGSGYESALVGGESSIKWGNSYKNKDTGKFVKGDLSDSSKKNFFGIYVSYAMAGLLEKGDPLLGKVGFRLDTTSMPEIDSKPIKLEVSEEAKNDKITKAIRDWLYYLLHPTEGIKYFAELVTNKINGFMLRWHQDMSGTEGVGVLPGTTRYLGFSGYVTTPEFTDLQWTNSLMNWYNSMIIYFIVFMFIVMVCYVLLGILTAQKSLVGLIIFSIAIFFPILIINWAAGISNQFSNYIYGSKFAYWGIVQQESYFSDLAKSIDSSKSTYKNYLLDLYEKNAEESSNQGGDNIVLRWQAPKKMSSLVMTKDEKDSVAKNRELSDMLDIALDAKATGSGEHYLGNIHSNYFYRSYTDIANISMFTYGDMVSNGKARSNVDSFVSSGDLNKFSEGLKNAYNDLSKEYSADRESGYANPDGTGSADGSQAYRIHLPLASSIYTDASSSENVDRVQNLKIGEYLGIDQRMFKFSLALLNSNADLMHELTTNDFDASQGGKYNNADIKALADYGIYSENVFYYFSWGLYDQGLTSNPSGTGGFRKLLLSKPQSGYFYNTEGNNEMRDYLDMKSLFTYVIPYLRRGNDIVREWDKRYGVFFYSGVTYEEGHENDPDILADPELAQKYWHNVNVARLYNIYTPWVDLMYDAEYAKPERVSYQGKTYTIQNPIDPASYPKERPMVFSKSEMYDYGLKESQLTEVERKIMSVSKHTMERWFKLLNYENFKDVTLNTSAAMEASFVFNTEFSQVNYLGSSINIYPQSFELKNFTYDAFLRMILANSTGEDLLAKDSENGGSVYERVVKKSSMTTSILLLSLDVVAIYAIPLLKMSILVLLFIAGIVVVFLSALSVREDIGTPIVKKMSKAMFVPALGYVGVSITMAWLVSLFMSDGNTAVTGYDGTSIVLGDPAMTLLAMLGINIVVAIAYGFVIFKLVKVIRTYGAMVAVTIGGAFGGIAGAVAGGIMGSIRRATGASGRASRGILGGTARSIMGTSRFVNNRLGITKRGLANRMDRMERKANARASRIARREARRAQREGYSGLSARGKFKHFMNRNMNKMKTFESSRRKARRDSK